jgi:hypothetical protein
MADIDPYWKWLGIPPHEQPPNCYRLLGIAMFESDPGVIANAADRQISHVRTYQTGSYSEVSQWLVSELSAARACLLDAARKAEYDQQLRQSVAARGERVVASPPSPWGAQAFPGAYHTPASVGSAYATGPAAMLGGQPSPVLAPPPAPAGPMPMPGPMPVANPAPRSMPSFSPGPIPMPGAPPFPVMAPTAHGYAPAAPLPMMAGTAFRMAAPSNGAAAAPSPLAPPASPTAGPPDPVVSYSSTSSWNDRAARRKKGMSKETMTLGVVLGAIGLLIGAALLSMSLSSDEKSGWEKLASDPSPSKSQPSKSENIKKTGVKTSGSLKMLTKPNVTGLLPERPNGKTYLDLGSQDGRPATFSSPVDDFPSPATDFPTPVTDFPSPVADSTSSVTGSSRSEPVVKRKKVAVKANNRRGRRGNVVQDVPEWRAEDSIGLDSPLR